jgi:hypothetical protein
VGFAVTFNQRQHDVLMSEADPFLGDTLLAANEGFILFDNLAAATHRREATSAECFAMTTDDDFGFAGSGRRRSSAARYGVVTIDRQIPQH